MQQLHPDKNSQRPFKEKYTAEKLYFILSKVYEEFQGKKK